MLELALELTPGLLEQLELELLEPELLLLALSELLLLTLPCPCTGHDGE